MVEVVLRAHRRRQVRRQRDDEPGAAGSFAEDVVFLRYAGVRVVVVHGGGPQITAHLEKLGVATEFRGGYRVTTPETMQIVRMVLVGQVNSDVVGLHQRARPVRRRAVRRGRPPVHGRAPGRHRRRRADRRRPGRRGRRRAAGDPARAARRGKVPVVATVARGENGEIFNVNADTAAAALAVALGAEKLVVLTDVEGLYADWPRFARRRGHQLADRRRARGAAALAVDRHGAEDGGLPAGRARRVPRAHVLDGRVRTRCCSSCSRMKASEPWWCRHDDG